MKKEKYDLLKRILESGIYVPNPDGRVFSRRTQKYLSERKDKDGYSRFSLHNESSSGRRFTIKKCYIIAFLKFGDKLIGPNILVDHKDQNKDNDSWDNIRLLNPHESAQNRGTTRFTKEEILQIRELYDQGISVKDIAKMFNTGKPNITRIGKRQRWNNI